LGFSPLTGAKVADIPDFSVMDFPQAGLLGVLLGKNPNGGSEYGTPQQECPKRSGLGILVICPESRMFGEPACSANSL